PGGLLGAIIAQVLSSGLNTVGATVLLITIAATGVLLVTNFSFVHAYEVLIKLVSSRFSFIGTLPQKFRAFVESRRELSRLRKERKLALKAEKEAARTVLKSTLSPADRVAEFMKEPPPQPATPIVRTEPAAEQVAPPTSPAQTSAAAS